VGGGDRSKGVKYKKEEPLHSLVKWTKALFVKKVYVLSSGGGGGGGGGGGSGGAAGGGGCGA